MGTFVKVGGTTLSRIRGHGRVLRAFREDLLAPHIDRGRIAAFWRTLLLPLNLENLADWTDGVFQSMSDLKGGG